MSSIVSARELRQGDSLLSYRIEKTLGHGRHGIVYLATDRNLNRQVTIKEYIPSDTAKRTIDGKVIPLFENHSEEYHWGLDQFIKEAQNLCKFSHPCIVHTLTVFEKNNTAYKVMELVEGVNFCTYLHKTESLSEAELKSVIQPVAEGLDEIHRLGFIHRDINPWNILLSSNGMPVLLDIHSNKITNNAPSRDVSLYSSASYAALEQFNPDIGDHEGPWTDIYALGGVLYLAISGHDPIESRHRHEMLSNGGSDPYVLAALIGKGNYSESFLDAVDWALQLQIAERPKTLVDWTSGGLFDEEFSEVSWDEFSDLLNKPFGAPAHAERSSSNQDTDATGQFSDFATEQPSPKASQGSKSRIIGFPIISTLIIAILLLIIFAAIVTGE